MFYDNHVYQINYNEIYILLIFKYFSSRQLGTSYLLATSGALITALGLNNLVKVCRDKTLHVIKTYFIILNLFFMSMSYLTEDFVCTRI